MELPLRLVTPGQNITYHCTQCGACCRQVKDSVMLESLDAYRLARHLRQTQDKAMDMEKFLLQYAHPISLNAGFPIFVLNTVGPQNTCVFLKKDLCSVQEAKTRACRLYPFTAGPGEDGAFTYFQCMEKPFHFKSGSVQVGTWMDANFTEEDRVYIHTEYESVWRMGRLFTKLPPERMERNMYNQLVFRYLNYDLDRPFLPQYHRNMLALEARLRSLCTKEAV